MEAKQNMILIETLKNYTEVLIAKLSQRYGFDGAEALKYVRSAASLETCADAEVSKTAEEAQEKRGRPEKKVKKVVNKGEMVEDKIQAILASELASESTVVAAEEKPKKKAAPKKKADAEVVAPAEAVVVASAEAEVVAPAAEKPKKKAVPKKKAEAEVVAPAEAEVVAPAPAPVEEKPKKKAAPKKKTPEPTPEPEPEISTELVEEELTEEEEEDDDEEEVAIEDWVDTDGTKYFLVKERGNLLLDCEEQTIVGRLVDGVKVDVEEDEE